MTISESFPSRPCLRVFLRSFFLAVLRHRFRVFAPEAVAGAVNENVFEGGLAHAKRLDLSGKGFDYVGDEAMSIFNFAADLAGPDGRRDLKLAANAVCQELGIARFEPNDVAADFAG